MFMNLSQRDLSKHTSQIIYEMTDSLQAMNIRYSDKTGKDVTQDDIQ